MTHELIDAMERKGSPADLFEDYAIQTPMTVLCELLGIPQKDEKLFRRWGKSIISTTSTDQEREGITIPSGEVVFLSSYSANYDEPVFQHADEIDFERQANPMIAFGRGIHACLGQQIARMEMQVLWGTLLKRLPTIRLGVAPSDVPWRPDETLTFGPAALPVIW